MTAPILVDHDINRAIGVVEVVDGCLYVRFHNDVAITREALVDIVGNAGLELLETVDDGNGRQLIRRARIREWSLPAWRRPRRPA